MIVVGMILPSFNGNISTVQGTVVHTGVETYKDPNTRGEARTFTGRLATVEYSDASGATVTTRVESDELQVGDRTTIWQERSLFRKKDTAADPARRISLAWGFIVGLSVCAGLLARVVARRKAKLPKGPPPAGPGSTPAPEIRG
ncbi:hypothetical protein DWQ67_06335 [Galactobacter caseinivorans]|uniref:DUF3592 domain-containing protein n=2 Tax=Galactobacter caseinivorans TaxID=2676123 RepID=A0A496PJP7_9MICC|nr:hypothetical protein DWQ67_06335 [Galactobacter caseinivorans]